MLCAGEFRHRLRADDDAPTGGRLAACFHDLWPLTGACCHGVGQHVHRPDIQIVLQGTGGQDIAATGFSGVSSVACADGGATASGVTSAGRSLAMNSIQETRPTGLSPRNPAAIR